jgi:hypothetical protein
MCSLCLKKEENSFHLFFQCPLAINIWKWFAYILNCTLQFQSKEDVWSLCNKGWNPQCKVVITSALVNIFNTIWYARNKTRFNNKRINWRTSISVIISNTSLAGNLTNKKGYSSMTDFIILKKFNVNLHPPQALQIIEVLWNPPISFFVFLKTMVQVMLSLQNSLVQ